VEESHFAGEILGARLERQEEQNARLKSEAAATKAKGKTENPPGWICGTIINLLSI
jgi:hypothetical protein